MAAAEVGSVICVYVVIAPAPVPVIKHDVNALSIWGTISANVFGGRNGIVEMSGRGLAIR